MNKKFDPKITKGPWCIKEKEKYSEELIVIQNEAEEIICDFGDEEQYYPTQGTEPNDEDLKAILAIPEMLEVIKAARELYPIDLDLLELKDVSSLQILNELLISVECVCNAIKKLDEKHGDEVINE